jgi:hypothetical protein
LTWSRTLTIVAGATSRERLTSEGWRSWRHAALASINPGKAIATLQDRYMNQQWAEEDPRFRTHIVTALGLGLNSHQQKPMLARSFQRVVFSTGVSERVHSIFDVKPMG